MKTVFHGKRISTLLGVLPQTSIRFEDEIENYTFPPKQTLRLQKVMGYKEHRIVKPTTATSDLCIAGLDHLLKKKVICREEIGAVIVATTSPDYWIPPVSRLVHGAFQLPEDVYCIDVNEGCAAFLMGLVQAMMTLEHMENGKKALVFASDVLSKKTSRQDRNSYPLIGDGAGIAIVENDNNAHDIHTVVYNSGEMGQALLIPAGGSRMPCTPETAVMKDENGDGNLRCLDNLHMDGAAVFNFVQTKVPPMIENVLAYAGETKEAIDWFLLHQPNKFMVRKLAEKLKIPYDKVPDDLVENYGNSSGACIPINAVHTLGDRLEKETFRCVLSAFGSGLCWIAMTMELGGLDCCEMLISHL